MSEINRRICCVRIFGVDDVKIKGIFEVFEDVYDCILMLFLCVSYEFINKIN